MQLVELHFRDNPALDYAAVKARAEQILGSELDSSPPHEATKAFLIFHKQHPVRYTEGEIPAQTAILTADDLPEMASYTNELQQSWACERAEELLSGSRSCRLVMEMMARGLPPADRVMLYHGVLQAMIEVSRPVALVYKHTQQVVAPADYLAACSKPPIFRPGSLNVRFFNIADSAGEKVMDTRGLTEVDLHDLQCHYRDLDPTSVSRVLHNTGYYIFEKGPVIESGQTVEGAEPGSRWKCQFEDALLEPKREVLDLNPGPRHAAGDR